MEVPQERVEKIQSFLEDRQKAEKFYDEQRLTSSEIQNYEKRLDNTLRGLQERVRRQQEDLRKVSKPKVIEHIGVNIKPGSSLLMPYSFAPPMSMISLKSAQTHRLALRKCEEPRRLMTRS